MIKLKLKPNQTKERFGLVLMMAGVMIIIGALHEDSVILAILSSTIFFTGAIAHVGLEIVEAYQKEPEKIYDNRAKLQDDLLAHQHMSITPKIGMIKRYRQIMADDNIDIGLREAKEIVERLFDFDDNRNPTRK